MAPEELFRVAGAVMVAIADGRGADAALLLEDVPARELRLLVLVLAGAVAGELARLAGQHAAEAMLRELIADSLLGRL